MCATLPPRNAPRYTSWPTNSCFAGLNTVPQSKSTLCSSFLPLTESLLPALACATAVCTAVMMDSSSSPDRPNKKGG